VTIAPGYRSLGLLRRGDGVDVYDAWSEERACRCVAKVLSRRKAGDARARRALLREGRLLLSLSHPHLVRAYTVVTEPRVALILETLPGETLSHLLQRRGRLAPRDVAILGAQLCSALHYLHGRGVLHLDVKPSNVVCRGGIASLIDLSIARPPGRGRPGVGTPDYLAPEQAAGGMLGPASDVFSLGVLLLEAATGTRPFHSDAEGGRFEQLLRKAKVTARCGMPAALRDLIERCLDPEPAHRPRVDAVRRAMEAVAGG
jgi:serine/threonine protein kinase